MEIYAEESSADYLFPIISLHFHVKILSIDTIALFIFPFTYEGGFLTVYLFVFVCLSYC